MRPAETHVWRAGLDLEGAALARLNKTLDPAERERAARFHFERDRRRFIAARGFLRQLLAGYLEVAPGSVSFAYNANGKPRLSAACQIKDDLRFNVSHSHALALFAFTLGREIGVDVERVKEMEEMEAIARQTFSAQEHAGWRAAAGAERTALFFRLWTRREAVVKCMGAGLATPGGPEPFGGAMADLAPDAGYAGAVAVESGPLDLAPLRSSDLGPIDPAPTRIH